MSDYEECLAEQVLEKPKVLPFLNVNLSVEENEPQKVKAVIYFSDGKEKKVLHCSILKSVDQHLREHLPHNFDLEKFRHEKALKKYGWRPGKNHRPGNYRVEWVEEGMNVLGTIDRWDRSPKEEETKKDGLKLLGAFDYFKGQAKDAIAYELASGEMKCRLEEAEKNHG